MKRVINNIISNSVKYMDKPKGIINIRIKDVGDFIQIEIEDNGRGIAAKDLPCILTGFTAQILPGIRHREEAESDFLLSRQSWKVIIRSTVSAIMTMVWNSGSPLTGQIEIKD